MSQIVKLNSGLARRQAGFLLDPFRFGAAPSGPTSSWDVISATYDSKYYDVTEEAQLNGFEFSPDGTIMYVCGTATSLTRQFSLSTPWDVSTATNTGKTLSAGARRGVRVHPDGTSIYVISSDSDTVNRYDMSTPFDLSTAASAQSFSVAAQAPVAQGLYLSPSGTKLYAICSSTDKLYQYALSTAWDLTTAAYENKSLVAPGGTPVDVAFSTDGTKMFIGEGATDRVYQYALSTPWDITTASSQGSLYIGGLNLYINGLSFSANGLKFYFNGQTPSRIFQFSVPEA